MKIKEVCEKTGLNDKTIRYYIRSGLIFPKYNENYTGRKNFDFAETDIERLNQVAVLRKYSFSINDIKSMLDDNNCIDDVIKNHIHNMKEETQNSVKLLSKLDEISDFQFSDIAALCDFLNKEKSLPASVPTDDSKKPYKLLYSKNKKLNIALIAVIIIIVIISAVTFFDIYNDVKFTVEWSTTDINNDVLIIENENYEIADKHWIPYGNAYLNGEYYLFKNDSKTIFAKEEESSLFEPIVYHNSSDVYPDISMTDRIDKITLQLDDTQIELNSDVAQLLANELNADSTEIKTTTADISTAEVYVNVYYKNYPAYQNEFVLCYSNDNQLGAMYCEAERNTSEFGKDNMVLFSNKELISYIKSLNLF